MLGIMTGTRHACRLPTYGHWDVFNERNNTKVCGDESNMDGGKESVGEKVWFSMPSRRVGEAG